MECQSCQKIHREIPDDIIPYKCICLADFCGISEAETNDYFCDTNT